MNAAPSPHPLDALYRAAEYRVRVGEQCLVTRIDACHEDLATLLQTHGAHSAVLITAWNPNGEACDAAANQQNQAQLLAWLARHGYRHLAAEGAASDGSWSEPAVLALDLSEHHAAQLAERFQQVAWVSYDQQGRARLCYRQPQPASAD